MTLDDLENIYHEAYWMRPHSGHDVSRHAGLRAVVEALRGEMVKCHLDGQEFGFADERTAMQGAEKFVAEIINEILASDGEVKAAGDSARKDELSVAVPSPCTSVQPAADLSGEWGSRLNETNAVAEIQMEPSVCEWRKAEFASLFKTGCNKTDYWPKEYYHTPKQGGYNFCPSCGKPISFNGGKQ